MLILLTVDGNWSELVWTGEQQPLTASCGVVVRKYVRYCNNPPPYNNGEPCLGDNNIYKDYNLGPCFGMYDLINIHIAVFFK